MAEALQLKQVVAAIILRGTQVLICQRRENQSFPLQWEFPGGKVEPGEDFPVALVRELHEELGITAVIGPEFATVRHTYAASLAVELHFFLVRDFTGQVTNNIFHTLRWEERAALDPEIFLEADREVVRRIRDGRVSHSSHPSA